MSLMKLKIYQFIFNRFLKSKTKYINIDIERRVGRLQCVINSGRNLRESKQISLKTPLRELVVVNSDLQFRKDIESLQNYIYEELNVRTVTISSDENKYGIQKYKIFIYNHLINRVIIKLSE